jgi:hypothetical protein
MHNISVYFNIRNTLPKFFTFLPGHPVYIVHLLAWIINCTCCTVRTSKKSVVCSVGGFTSTKLQVAASARFKAVRQTQEVPSFPARSKTNWKMLAWLHDFISATKPHFTSASATRHNFRIGFSKSWPRFGQRTGLQKILRMLCYFTSQNLHTVFFLQRNPSMETLAGLCINFIKIPLSSPSGKRSRLHPNNTQSQRQTRCGSEAGAAGPPDHRSLAWLTFIELCEAYSNIYNKHSPTGTQAHWSNGITIRGILLKVRA